MNFIINLLISLLLHQSVLGIAMDCEFKTNSEECKVTSLSVEAPDTEITSITGRHAFRKTNKDVKELWIIREVKTEFVPTYVCKFFENMERIDIYGTRIKAVTRSVFKNCAKVIKVCVLFTSVTTLPEDIFEDLSELKELLLYENKLIMLPAKLIASNPKLTSFSARNNQLQFIDLQFAQELIKIDLTSNLCINKKFPEDLNSVAIMNQVINGNCESPMTKTLIVKNERISQLQANLTSQNSEILRLKAQLKITEDKFVSNITALMLENENLNRSNGIHIKELEDLKVNNTEAIKKIYEENISLKSNVSTCQGEVAKKKKETEDIKVLNDNANEKSEKSQAEITILKLNLSSTVADFDESQTKIDLLMVDNMNLNDSLEECWQNLSSVNNDNRDLEANLERADKNCSEIITSLRQTHSERIGHETKVDLVYVIFLGFVSASIMIAIVLFMRRQAQRNLIRTMINHQVKMGNLINE